MIDPRLPEELRLQLRAADVDWRNAYAGAADDGVCRVFPAEAAERCSRPALAARGLATIGSPLEPLRAEPAHRSELVSELRGGEHLTLLDLQSEWALVQGEDGYVGWVASWSLQLQQPAEREALEARLLGHYARPLGTLWDSDRWAASPLTLGTPLLRPGDEFDERGGQHLVELPWGARGWLPGEDVEWLGPERTDGALPAAATMLLGTPYRWGGRSAASLDCSGYVQLVFERAGIRLPRDSSQQSRLGEALALEPGAWRCRDLLFFGEPADHVGIYDGKGGLLHCRAFVRRQKLEEIPELLERLSAVRRIPARLSESTLWLRSKP